MSVFDQYKAKAWPHRFEATIHLPTIAGGTPTDPKVATAWLKTKLAAPDDLIREKVAEIMVERGVTADAAADALVDLAHLTGFKRDEQGLYLEGRCMKSAIKEAASICMAAGKLPISRWGLTNKGLKSFVPEHIFVLDDRMHLGVAEPTGVVQRFVMTWRGTGIDYREYVEDAKLSFTVVSDWDFTHEQWAMIWLTAEQNGVGASRSQGFGRFTVERWEAV